jgi:class 3 adenylate cyclase/tetratricopeptide (TPR) repeat protein
VNIAAGSGDRLAALPKGTVTFMLTDIEGSTRLWQANREAMARSVRRHDQVVASSIEKNHGAVLKDRGEGDSFFAVFARASDGVRAACRIQRELHRRKWPKDARLRVRIAIYAGEADEESDQDYRGLAVNRCARLRALARGGQVLLSSSVHELARDHLPAGVSAKDLGERRLRDLDRPEHVYLVVDRALPADASVETLQTPPVESRPTPRPVRRALCPILVGREGELRLLDDFMMDAAGRAGSLILLAGEAGIGKTRLAEELQRRAAEAGIRVMWGSCSQAELALPYLPIVEAVGNFLGTIDLSALRQQLGSMAHELGHLFPQLAGDGPTLDSSDAGAARLRLFESILALLRLAAEPGRLLLVVEDVHWADASTRELLDYLVRRLHQARTTVLLTYRHDELRVDHPLQSHLQSWLKAGLATRIELMPLTGEGVAGVVGAIFEQGAITPEFRDYLQARSEGNPFVLEEMLKSAIDLGEIYRTESGWERKPLSELKIPATVREVIQQRLSRLDPTLADLVRTAAVLGDSFTYEAWVAASWATEEVVRGALRECVEQQFMNEESDQRFRFRHALTRQAIYEDLLGPERAARHRKAAAALRNLPGTPAVELAHHLVLAGQWEEAVPELLRAGEEAESRRGYTEAAHLYKLAQAHVGDAALWARLACREAQAWYLAGEPTRAQPLLEEGIGVLERAGHVEEAATFRMTLGFCHWLAARNDQARAEFENVRSKLESGGASETLALAYNDLAFLALNDGDAETTLNLTDLAIRTADVIGADRPRIWAQIYRGCALVDRGSIDAGLIDLDRSWHEAIEHQLTDLAGIALSNAVHQRVKSFRAAETAPLLDRLEALPQIVHTGGRLATWILMRRAFSSIVLGDMTMALTAAVEGLRQAQLAQSMMMLVAEFAACSAIAECGLGRNDEARDRVTRLALPEVAEDTEAAWGVMRVWLDLGETPHAFELAIKVMDYLDARSSLNIFDAWLLDKAIEVFHAARALDGAERLGRAARMAPSAAGPLIDRIEGRLALFNTDLTQAGSRLASAAQRFQACSYRDDEWRTRRALAEVKVSLGDRASAEHELGLVIAGAVAHGHVFEAAAARRQLTELLQTAGGS